MEANGSLPDTLSAIEAGVDTFLYSFPTLISRENSYLLVGLTLGQPLFQALHRMLLLNPSHPQVLELSPSFYKQKSPL